MLTGRRKRTIISQLSMSEGKVQSSLLTLTFSITSTVSDNKIQRAFQFMAYLVIVIPASHSPGLEFHLWPPPGESVTRLV